MAGAPPLEAEPQKVAVNKPAAPEAAVVSCFRPYIWQKLAQRPDTSKWIRVGYGDASLKTKRRRPARLGIVVKHLPNPVAG